MVSAEVRSGLRKALAGRRHGLASAGSVLAYFMLPQVSANCHCAAAIERIDDSADASFPRACMPRYSLKAIASRTAMIASTTINSISVKPDRRGRDGRGFCGFCGFWVGFGIGAVRSYDASSKAVNPIHD